MRKIKIKTVDVQARSWFDRTCGNSYFAAKVTLNFGMKTERSFFIPLQYGYGDHYRDVSFEKLQKLGYIPKQESNVSYWRYYEENKIIARHSMNDNCLKRELKEW